MVLAGDSLDASTMLSLDSCHARYGIEKVEVSFINLGFSIINRIGNPLLWNPSVRSCW